METKTFLLTTSFYPPYHIGGDAIHVEYLSQELASRGHEVHVLHSIDAYRLKSRAEACRTEDDDGVYIHPVKSPFGILSVLSAYAMGKSLRVSHKFDELVKELSPDVVHHHNISLLGIDILRKRRSYVNLHTTHDYWLLCPRNDMMREGRDICTEKSCMSCTLRSWRLWQPWRRLKHLQSVLADVDRIIAPSRNLQSLLSEEFDTGIRQIYNFAPEPPTRTRDIDDYFLFVGVLEEHKGIRFLVDAFEEAATDMRLVIVGDGSLCDYLRKRSLAAGLKDRIRIVGKVGRDSLYGYYNKAVALVLPSICLENCPLVVLEALSVGTPVLGSDLGGIGEIIRLSKSGIAFDCNRSQIKVSLESMASDVSLQREFSANARESYRKWFSPSVYMRAYEDEISNFNYS